MAWYKTGTVSVTNGSTAVSGVGTKWVSNTRVGDGFRAPDGEWYEIVNIASETTLGIYPPYQGVTIVDSTNYMVAPLQGYNKESADRLRGITDSFRDIDEQITIATDAATAAKLSETNSKDSETKSKTSETNSANSATAANTAKLAAETAKTSAETAATTATTKASEASTSASTALTQANRAKTEADNAAASLSGKQNLNANLTALSGLTGAADRLPYFTGVGALSLSAYTAKARLLLARTDNAGMQSELGLGNAATATVTSSSVDTTTSRLLKVGDFGLGGSVVSIPATTMNDATIPTGNYVADNTITNTPYTGAFWGVSIVRFSTNSSRQIAWDLNSPSALYFRNIDRGTIVAWQPLYNGLNAQLDPQTAGGLMSTTTVSGFVINKYLNGDMHMMGRAPTTSTLTANSVLSIIVTIPSGFLSAEFIYPDATLAPSTANDHYGYISKTPETTTQLRFFIRTGATAQTYNLNLSIWGRWK